MSKPLLPIGCYDLLPPAPRQQFLLAGNLLQGFESFGYQQVSPSLLEYSENLLAGREELLSPQIFRVMDGSSHKVIGIRPDITLQISRLVKSRLAEFPLPLRVCYNGLILRMQPDQPGESRQLRQAGIELIGADSPEADAEVISVAIDGLRKAGVKELSVDLNLPGMVSSLLEKETLSKEDKATLLDAINHKDVSTVNSMNISCRDTLVSLLQSAGDADSALRAIESLELPQSAKKQYTRLKQVVTLLNEQTLSHCNITIDATEVRGMNYHEGISFSVFTPGASCEVGRGGRYLIERENGQPITATGFTLYVETLGALLPAPELPKSVLVIGKPNHKETVSLREKGYITIHALPDQPGTIDEARRLGCTYIWKNGTIEEIKKS